MWTSSHGPVEVPGTTLHELVLAAARRFPDRPALIDGETGLTVPYGLLASRIEGVAAGLAARGFGPSDVLALYAPNMPQWAGVALGAMAAGGTVTGANPAYTERELTAQLDDSGASILVTVPQLVPKARATRVREIIVLGEATGATGVTPIAEVLAAGRPAVPLDPDTAVALMPYSSGTTGGPKGVLLTHANLVSAVHQFKPLLRITSEDTVLAVAPYFHSMGFVLTLAVPLAAGATVVTMPRFDLERFLTLIQRHRVTFLVVAPPIMAALARHPLVDAFDLSSVNLIGCGGAPLSAELQRAVAGRFPDATVGQGWGMTETTVGVTSPDRQADVMPGSVGRLVANTELRVVDPVTGRDLDVAQQGELWVRGPQLMTGYHNRPEATADTIDAAGWLHTGDLGYVDADGNVFVVDRLKELIKVNAYQVAPSELEALLIGHPGVADAAVIGRPDEARGEVPVAVVVPHGDLDQDELMDWVAARVAPYKRIHAVRLVDTLPRTPSGKLLRRLLCVQDPVSHRPQDPARIVV